VVVTLVENDTAMYGDEGVVVNEIFCVKAVVDPSKAAGVQAAGLGVTPGGWVPVATRVAFSKLHSSVSARDGITKLPVPDTLTVDGMAAGTAVMIFPSGTVATALKVPSPLGKLQLMPIVSGAPTLSVIVTVTARGEAEQRNGAVPMPN
jgi:hypothetical protein